MGPIWYMEVVRMHSGTGGSQTQPQNQEFRPSDFQEQGRTHRTKGIRKKCNGPIDCHWRKLMLKLPIQSTMPFPRKAVCVNHKSC